MHWGESRHTPTLGEEGLDAGGSLLLKSIRSDLATPLIVGDIMCTSTSAVAGANDWIEEVAENVV